MNTQDIRLGKCLSDGWQAIGDNMGIAIGTAALYIALSGVAGGTGLGTILAAFPLAGGFTMIYLGLAKHLPADIATLFAGFSSVDNWARWLGVGWLLYLYQTLLTLICIVISGAFIGPGIYLVATHHSLEVGITLIVVGALATILGIAGYSVRWSFVFLAGAEGATAFDAIRISTELTQGLRWRIFWIMFVLGLINLLGIICAFVGIFLTIPITQAATSSLYIDLKRVNAQRACQERPIG